MIKRPHIIPTMPKGARCADCRKPATTVRLKGELWIDNQLNIHEVVDWVCEEHRD